MPEAARSRSRSWLDRQELRPPTRSQAPAGRVSGGSEPVERLIQWQTAPRTLRAVKTDINILGLSIKTFGLFFALNFAAWGLLAARRLKELGRPGDWAYEMVT